MRIVLWNPQERVDLPDLTASSYLVLGEFRRTVRGVLLGENVNRIIRGFKCEPNAVPDATVLIKLDPGGGGALSFAFASENLGARIDYGQLMGGDNSDGQLEGNAQISLDFTGQPVAVYRVQIRFTHADAVTDNRAFWDEDLNSEFYDAVETRTLPIPEGRRSGAASDEWIDIADVDWDGVGPILSGDITDVRTFVHEGALAQFDATSQEDASSPYPDFDRSTDRATNGVNALYQITRALGRQVMDLKGQDGSGNFNWYARPFRPYTAGGATLIGAKQTKSLRTVDTVTYTVGDGTTTFGEFNGASGLENCLQHLEDLGANVPDNVLIVLKHNNAAGFTWNVTTSHVYSTAFHLEIRGDAGGRAASLASTGRAEINITTIAAAGFVVHMTATNSSLTLRQIATTGVEPTNAINGFVVDGGPIKVIDCFITGDLSTGSGPVIQGLISRSEIRNSIVQGLVSLSAHPSGAYVEGATIENVDFLSAALEILENGVFQARGLVVRNCRFDPDTFANHGFGLDGAIDLGTCADVLIDSCEILYVPDVDGIHFEVVGSNIPQRITIRSCQFDHAAAGSHGVGAGINGTNGSGWNIYGQGTSSNLLRQIHVSECRFSGGRSIDGGGVMLSNADGWTITGCEVTAAGHTATASTTCTGIRVHVSTTATDVSGKIANCTFGRWDAATSGDGTRTCGIRISDAYNVSISGCDFDGKNTALADINSRAASGCAILLDGTNANDIQITGCFFVDWNPNAAAGTANSRCVVNTATTLRDVIIMACEFQDVGGYAVDYSGPAAASCIVSNCIVRQNDNGQGFNFEDAALCAVNGNVMAFGFGGAEAVRWGAVAGACVCQGNVCPTGDIQRTSGTVRGYNHDPAGTDDFNVVNAYTA